MHLYISVISLFMHQIYVLQFSRSCDLKELWDSSIIGLTHAVEHNVVELICTAKEDVFYVEIILYRLLLI